MLSFVALAASVCKTIDEKGVCITETGEEVATLGFLDSVFENIVSVSLGLAGIILFVMLLLGGFRYISAGNDPKAVEGAKKTLTFAIGGIVLTAIAFLILRFIEVFTGVNVTEFSVIGQ